MTEEKFIVTKSQLRRLVEKSAGSDLVMSAAKDGIARAKSELSNFIISNKKQIEKLKNKITTLENETKEFENRIKSLNPKDIKFNKITVYVYSKDSIYTRISFDWDTGGTETSIRIAKALARALADNINKSKFFDKDGKDKDPIFSTSASHVKLEYAKKFMKFNNMELLNVADIDNFLSIIK